MGVANYTIPYGPAGGAFPVVARWGRLKPGEPGPGCGPVCQLYDGWAHLERDTSFTPPPNLTSHAETSTVFFGGEWLMYSRSFVDNNGILCNLPTGIALSRSDDGNTWTAVNGGRPLPNLATTAPGDPDGCPQSAEVVGSVWAYAPDVIVDGSGLAMLIETRTHLGVNNDRHEVRSSASGDGASWSPPAVVLQPNANELHVGTPDLLKIGSTYELSYHALANTAGCATPGVSSCFIRGRATSTNLSAPFTRQAIPMKPKPQSWRSFGPGLGDVIQEGGWYYLVLEGWSGASGECGRASGTWSASGLARSLDLVTWQYSDYSPFMADAFPSCGLDMPNWQVPADGVPRIITTPAGSPESPLEGKQLPRWRIVRTK